MIECIIGNTFYQIIIYFPGSVIDEEFILNIKNVSPTKGD